MNRARVVCEYIYPDAKHFPECRQFLAEVVPTFVHQRVKEWILVTVSKPGPNQGISIYPATRDGTLLHSKDPILKVRESYDIVATMRKACFILEENPRARKVKV